MSLSLVGLWILVGWCGTPWPRPWPFPVPPDPWPWWYKLVDVVGGFVGGWLYTQVFPVDEVTAIGAAATGLGAFIGAVVLHDIFGAVMSPRKQM